MQGGGEPRRRKRGVAHSREKAMSPTRRNFYVHRGPSVLRAVPRGDPEKPQAAPAAAGAISRPRIRDPIRGSMAEGVRDTVTTRNMWAPRARRPS